MNALLGLVRLHVNRRDVVVNWTKMLTRVVSDEQQAWAAVADDRRKKRPPGLPAEREGALPPRRLADLLAAQTTPSRRARPGALHSLASAPEGSGAAIPDTINRGDQLAISGEKPCPSVGKSAGRHWGESRDRRHHTG